jgi:hypothetical protein
MKNMKLTFGPSLGVALIFSVATLAPAFSSVPAPLRMSATEKTVLFAQPELTHNLKDWANRFVVSAEKMRDSKAINITRLRGQVEELVHYVDPTQPQAPEYLGKIRAFRARVTPANFAAILEEAKEFRADLNSIPTF